MFKEKQRLGWEEDNRKEKEEREKKKRKKRKREKGKREKFLEVLKSIIIDFKGLFHHFWSLEKKSKAWKKF